MIRRQLIIASAFVFFACVLIVHGNAEKKKELTFWGKRPSPAIFYGIQKDQKSLEPKFDLKNIQLIRC